MYQIISNSGFTIIDPSSQTRIKEPKWSWACRILEQEPYRLEIVKNSSRVRPRAGDVAVASADRIGYHSSIVSIDNRKLRIYPGDIIVGVFGNRYATDALEAEIKGLTDLSLLTGGGMIGSIKSKHSDFGKPTTVSFLGFISDRSGNRINLKQLKFHPTIPKKQVKNLIVMLGTGMNAGKTTTARILVKGLSKNGVNVAACKLTGSVSNRDQDELRSATANHTIDFSDYGFPSTYLCSKEELFALFNTMLADLQKGHPDVIVMEVADGLLQRETSLLLSDPYFKRLVTGVVLAADSSTSALFGVERLTTLGYRILAVSGAITSSPLFMKEFKHHNSKVEIAPSIDGSDDLVRIVNGIRG